MKIKRNRRKVEQLRALEKIDAEIASLFLRVEGLQAIRKALDNPDLVDTLSAVFGDSRLDFEAAPPPAPPDKPSNYDKIVAFFLNNGNHWSTGQEVQKATGVLSKSARDVMARTQEKHFENRQNNANDKKYFRLRAIVYGAFMEKPDLLSDEAGES